MPLTADMLCHDAKGVKPALSEVSFWDNGTLCGASFGSRRTVLAHGGIAGMSALTVKVEAIADQDRGQVGDGGMWEMAEGQASKFVLCSPAARPGGGLPPRLFSAVAIAVPGQIERRVFRLLSW